MEATHQTLDELGWRAFFSAQVPEADDNGGKPYRVMAVHRGKIAVAGEGGVLDIQPGFGDGLAAEDHPTVGDWVLIDPATLQITQILQRASLFKRRAPGGDQKTQLIAANVDTLFIVASCNQDFSIPRLERYLILAREVGVHPVIVLTKTDLTDTPEVFAAAARDLQPGLQVETINGKDPTSAARLSDWCGKGQTVALVGSSGVGKSTLVNTLRGSNSIATQDIRKADGTGRHTTTVREMHRLHQGGWLLDTPGMRELQLTDVASGLAVVFADIVEATEQCHFSDCAHKGEPGCAVQAAINDGRLTPARLDRWRALVAEETYNSASPAERRALDRIAAAAAAKRK
ncbi:ribosome small subunit-dependent GTPase A [Sphingobium terrigena]|uniref:Small ribosomal subunit biogenesis GTPase RsgA n=1 Tax=Sphingobium terrigena TaxID=2304063 RepID=A0A418YPK6_9SPHN|nr:ribosome small subunit-dependent GTPase A [Sphingobium terrigena]RJG53287.1 ribosome small subunit-dependent GTPase A [Sphingobium terrigena]